MAPPRSRGRCTNRTGRTPPVLSRYGIRTFHDLTIVRPQADARAHMDAFAALAPVSEAYAHLPVAEAFDWSRVGRQLGTGEWYLVAFRSIRRLDADEVRLTEFDDRAHHEAQSSPGFVHYFKGPAAADRSCLSFCLWTSRAEARAAAGRPAHIEAVSVHQRDVRALHARVPARHRPGKARRCCSSRTTRCPRPTRPASSLPRVRAAAAPRRPFRFLRPSRPDLAQPGRGPGSGAGTLGVHGDRFVHRVAAGVEADAEPHAPRSRRRPRSRPGSSRGPATPSRTPNRGPCRRSTRSTPRSARTSRRSPAPTARSSRARRRSTAAPPGGSSGRCRPPARRR